MSTIAKRDLPVMDYGITNAAILAMKDAYMPLTIAGIDDSAGYKRVHEARMVVKNKRVEVEKMRKSLKEDSLRWGRAVDAEAKRITALLEPIEIHLETQQRAIDAEKQRIIDEAKAKLEAEARAKAEAEEAQRRAEQAVEEARLKAIRDAEDARLKAEREKLDAERREMEAARKAAQDRVDAERRAIEAAQKVEQDKLDAERRAIEAERKRLDDIEAARLRAIEDERIRAEAAEQARIETEARIAREAAEAKARAEAEEAARRRAEAMRPDREKLLAVAQAVLAVPLPEVSAEAVPYLEEIKGTIEECANIINHTVKSMITGELRQ